MDGTVHATFIPPDGPHAPLAFCRDHPEVVPAVLLVRAGLG
ncbi:hypothetical protein ACNTMW_07255 [Planosporangium sp. 12N6]